MEKVTQPKLAITEDQAKEVAQLLALYLPKTLVWAFGSRVKGTANTRSDLDLVAFADKPQDLAVYQLQQAFEESSLPFRVDLLVWDNLTPAMQNNIRERYVVVQGKRD
ncbi:nucleotidyltransferase domain-containing protein [Vibrio cidicii]|uniref:nucleotidyltransferase family protein n=1 Tax=Vibrio cidicii TaxID=1763883 RepID=UPI0008196AC1|nr:nucleotidyltransferase domain-containing protein [Vibrio cidicii]ELV8626731.1 nucleotidyltransferase domain-containing protein [Vibrio cidicii]